MGVGREGKQAITEHPNAECHSKQGPVPCQAALVGQAEGLFGGFLLSELKEQTILFGDRFYSSFSHFLRFSRQIHTVLIFGSSFLRTDLKISF